MKFISIDFFDIKDNPPPALPFPVPLNYVPAAPSTLKSLEDAVVKAVNRFPQIADQLVLVTTQVNHLLSSIDDEKIPQQAGLALSRASDLLGALQVTVKQADVGGLSSEARHTIGGLNGAIAHLDGILTRMSGDKGILVSAQRATDSIGDLAGGAKSIGTELRRHAARRCARPPTAFRGWQTRSTRTRTCCSRGAPKGDRDGSRTLLDCDARRRGHWVRLRAPVEGRAGGSAILHTGGRRSSPGRPRRRRS